MREILREKLLEPWQRKGKESSRGILLGKKQDKRSSERAQKQTTLVEPEELLVWAFDLDYKLDLLLPRKGVNCYVTWEEGRATKNSERQ